MVFFFFVFFSCREPEQVPDRTQSATLPMTPVSTSVITSVTHSDTVNIPEPTDRDPITPQVSSNTKRTVTFQATRLDMPPAAESLWRQARSSLVLAGKAKARSDWLHQLNSRGILTQWGTAEIPLPLYARTDDRLTSQIAKIRKEAAIQVQLVVANELDRKATANDKDSITILRTVETLLQDSNTCTFDAAKQKLASVVGKENAVLIKQLEKQTDFLKDHQRPDPDFTLGLLTFPVKLEAGSRPSPTTITPDITPNATNPLQPLDNRPP